MFKEGYENGEKKIEIYDGKFDVVIFSEDENRGDFYYYRFDSLYVLGEKKRLKRDVNIIDESGVRKFLSEKGIDYDSLLQRLLKMAWSSEMKARTDM